MYCLGIARQNDTKKQGQLVVTPRPLLGAVAGTKRARAADGGGKRGALSFFFLGGFVGGVQIRPTESSRPLKPRDTSVSKIQQVTHTRGLPPPTPHTDMRLLPLSSIRGGAGRARARPCAATATLLRHGLSTGGAPVPTPHQQHPKPVVGVVGVGKMGSAMASNFLKAGVAGEVVVYDRFDRQAVQALAGEGAVAAGSLKEVGRRCSTVVSMLPNDDVLTRCAPRAPISTGLSSTWGLPLHASTTLHIHTQRDPPAPPRAPAGRPPHQLLDRQPLHLPHARPRPRQARGRLRRGAYLRAARRGRAEAGLLHRGRHGRGGDRASQVCVCKLMYVDYRE